MYDASWQGALSCETKSIDLLISYSFSPACFFRRTHYFQDFAATIFTFGDLESILSEVYGINSCFSLIRGLSVVHRLLADTKSCEQSLPQSSLILPSFANHALWNDNGNKTRGLSVSGWARQLSATISPLWTFLRFLLVFLRYSKVFKQRKTTSFPGP